jgi:predicted short-subunit dehydrogenase-like oxidoreductase (DUF2520 family)
VNIGIIGRGRLGATLAPLWRARGHHVVTYGREPVAPGHDVVLIAVPDRAIAEVSASIQPGPVVLHASGATDVEVLRPHRPAGSLHPLMTFPGVALGAPPIQGVVAAVAGDPGAVEVATRLATDLGMTPFAVHGDRRLYHAAAVIAGNYAATLLLVAGRVLSLAGAPPEEAANLLLPLAEASLQNVARHGARAMTGPAVRGDLAVLAGHHAALSEANLDEVATLVDALAKATVSARRFPDGSVDPG